MMTRDTDAGFAETKITLPIAFTNINYAVAITSFVPNVSTSSGSNYIKRDSRTITGFILRYVSYGYTYIALGS